MSRFNLVVDGPGHMVYYRRRAGFGLPFTYNRLGATFAPQTLESDALRARVIQEGPAWKAGVRNGDQLLKLDGKEVRTWRDAVARVGPDPFEQKAGTRVRLTLSRGARTFDVIAVLDDLFPSVESQQSRSASSPP